MNANRSPQTPAADLPIPGAAREALEIVEQLPAAAQLELVDLILRRMQERAIIAGDDDLPHELAQALEALPCL